MDLWEYMDMKSLFRREDIEQLISRIDQLEPHLRQFGV